MKRKAPVPSPSLKVQAKHLPSPDAQQRLARAFDLVLKAAARAEEPADQDRHDMQEYGSEEVADE